MTDLLPTRSPTPTEEPPIPADPASLPDPIVRLLGLSCRRGSTLALDGVDLDVRRGELVAVLGPSGCGKTTLLRTLAGLERPSAGRIEIEGQLVNDPSIRVPARQRRVGLVFQDLALWPHWSAERHLEFVLEGRGGSSATRRERVRETLALFRLDGLEKRRPSELSGGECQRLALARSVVATPALWLLDEPLSSLDAHLRLDLRNEIARIHRELGLSSLLVTHDQVEAFALADRVAVLRSGRLEQFDRPDRLYAEPASLFVAGFVGRLLPLPARLSGTTLETDLGSFELTRAPASITGGLRPESVRIVAAGETAARGVVRHVHPAGATTQVTVVSGETELRLELTPDAAPALGDEVGLELLSSPLIFDESGRPLGLES